MRGSGEQPSACVVQPSVGLRWLLSNNDFVVVLVVVVVVVILVVVVVRGSKMTFRLQKTEMS